MYKVKINISLRENILDPQGKAVNNALHQLGYEAVEQVRVGKYIELYLQHTNNLEQQIENMCRQVLVNSVIEDFQYSIENV
ncbi:MAG: phosphoribosylformylglycinamidine synthase subunit PurS [Sphingobacteriales bacterium]|nr:phosphoribosylformylglycinamidine synthase subunit PurS [Sphingobacteriales bacterium]